MQIGEVCDTIGADYTQSERFDRQISEKVCGKVGKIIFKCVYFLNIRMFCVFFNRKLSNFVPRTTEIHYGQRH